MGLIRNFFVVIILISIFFSCSSDDAPQNRVLIFGWYADSSCGGDCSQIYKIDSEKVFKDIDFNYPEGNYFEGNFKEITTVNYKDIVVLLNQLPEELLGEPNGYLDCSDCTDERGGFYLEYSADKIHKTWRFRNAQYPSYMESYRSLLLDKLAELNSN